MSTITSPPTSAPQPAPGGQAAAGSVDATKVYGIGDAQVRALDGVTVAFETGKFTAIMGPSGSGKSTLLHCLAGLDSLSSGATYVGDTYLATLDDRALTELRRTKVGFVFQAYNLIPTLTAEENIKLPMLLGGDDGDQAWIDHVVSTVGLAERFHLRALHDQHVFLPRFRWSGTTSWAGPGPADDAPTSNRARR